MIEESIKIHDKFQFEIKLNYEMGDSKNIPSYRVDSYLFLPSRLGVNPSTYQKEDFYFNIQNYTRFKTPSVSLKIIANGTTSPLGQLKKSCKTLIVDYNKESISDYEYQIKMFCSIFKSALRDQVNFILTKSNTAEISNLISQYISVLIDITKKYRKLRQILNMPNLHENTYSIFTNGDEYISLLIEKHSFRLLEFLKEIEDLDSLHQTNLIKLIEDEIAYRTEWKYDSISKLNSDNESFIYRFSILKKYIESVLYIDINKKIEGRFVEQLLLGFAAGIAMIFATSVLFFSQPVFGDFTLPLFFIIVVSYIFKDRIKDITKIFLTDNILKMLSDHKTEIKVNGKNKIGVCRESFNFIEDSKVPQRIAELLAKGKTQEFQSKFLEEEIIHYQKDIKLYPKRCKKIYHDYQIGGINEIIRFNVSPFLSKMDNPNKSLFVLNEKSYQKVPSKRTYHINLIQRYAVNNIFHYKHYRLVLARNGIKRIEEIFSEKTSIA